MSGRPEGKVAGISGGTRGIHVHTALQGGFIMKGWTNDELYPQDWGGAVDPALSAAARP